MNPVSFQQLYDYNYWAHRQVWTLIQPLSDEQFTQMLAYPEGSVRGQCVHVIATESWWFHFLDTGELKFLDQEAYTTKAEVRTEWDACEARVRRYLAKLTTTELERDVRPPPPEWDEGRLPIKVWQALIQVANHSTDHRAQLMAGLHTLGIAGIEQDFLGYLFEKQIT